MGEIYLARLEGAQGFEKLCVIKKILPQLAADTDFVERFVGEARTLVRLSHGSIAQVLDMGLHEGEAYMALEHVDGKDLRKVAARVRDRQMPLPVTFILYTMGRVLDALAYAHRKKDDDGEDLKLVHRDISPQNILISYEGEVKVIDFGLAKSRLSAAKTNPSIILGKFLYMSPEQARHQPVDRRSDLYAVGLCLYELICGKNPFDGVHPGELMSLVAHPRIKPLDEVEPLTPPVVTALVAKALAVDPSQRFQTAEEFRGRLQACLMEIDSSAGPESVSRFMRELFSADFQSERRLLASLKDVPRLSTEESRALASMPDDPLLPKMTHATLPPKTIRLDGPVEPLSFFPTPRSREGGGPVTDGETRPGVPMDESTRPAVPIEALEEEARARRVRHEDTAPSVEVGPEAFVRGGGSGASIPRAPAMTREIQMTSMPAEAVPPGVAAARALLPSHLRPTELAMPSLGEPSSEAPNVRGEPTNPKAEPPRSRAADASAPQRAPLTPANARPSSSGSDAQASGAVLPRTGVVVMPAVNVPEPAPSPRAPALASTPSVELLEGAGWDDGDEAPEEPLSDDSVDAEPAEASADAVIPDEPPPSWERAGAVSVPPPPPGATPSQAVPSLSTGAPARTASVVMAAVAPPPPGATPSQDLAAAASRSLESSPAPGAMSSGDMEAAETSSRGPAPEHGSPVGVEDAVSASRSLASAAPPSVEGPQAVAPPRSLSSAELPAVDSQDGASSHATPSMAGTSASGAPASRPSAVGMAAVSAPHAGTTPSRGVSSLGAPPPPPGATPSRAIPAAASPRPELPPDEPAVDATPAHGGRALSPEDEATSDEAGAEGSALGVSPEESGPTSGDAHSHADASEPPVLSTEDEEHEDAAQRIANADTHPRIHRPSRPERHADTQPRVAHYADTDPRVTRNDDTQPRVVLDAGLLRDVEGSERGAEEKSGVSRPRPHRGRASSPGMASAGTARRTGSVSAVRPAPASVETEEDEDESDDDVRINLVSNEETRRTTMPVRPETRSADRIAKEDTRRTSMPERPARPARRKGPMVLVLALVFVGLVGGAVFLAPPELRTQWLSRFMPKEPQGPPPELPLRPSAPGEAPADGPPSTQDAAQAGKPTPEAPTETGATAKAAPGASPAPTAKPAPTPTGAGATAGAAPSGGEALDDSFLAPLGAQQNNVAPARRAPTQVRKVRSSRARQLTTLEKEWRETNALFNKLNAVHSCVVLGLWCTRYEEVRSEVEAAGTSNNPEALRKVRAMKRYLLQKQKELN
ncbi:serine/threonine protein kinase [Corallococcus macrosporus]|uniref:Serine/threonine protein kinase n=2 Tax=Myxococcaceae TaxID=31 RepID=F8CBM3_MYXFH|nr:serine/threonine protein kinase [Corallococcus macrosporus]